MTLLKNTMKTPSLKLGTGWTLLLQAINRMKLPTLSTDVTYLMRETMSCFYLLCRIGLIPNFFLSCFLSDKQH